jgi:hypothetical protein
MLLWKNHRHSGMDLGYELIRLTCDAMPDTDAVKQMVSEGKVVVLRKGALVYLEDVDVRDGIVKVRSGREYHNRLDSKPIPELLNALIACIKNAFCFGRDRFASQNLVKSSWID